MGSNVKAQVRDLRYDSGNFYPNQIIRHMLTKWTDHPLGMGEWGVRMALKGFGISKFVYLALAMHVYYSMYFYYLLLIRNLYFIVE